MGQLGLLICEQNLAGATGRGPEPAPLLARRLLHTRDRQWFDAVPRYYGSIICVACAKALLLRDDEGRKSRRREGIPAGKGAAVARGSAGRSRRRRSRGDAEALALPDLPRQGACPDARPDRCDRRSRREADRRSSRASRAASQHRMTPISEKRPPQRPLSAPIYPRTHAVLPDAVVAHEPHHEVPTPVPLL
jgi:hypothetical protein